MTASEFLQALATGSAIIDTDNVVVYSSGGEALKIPAKVVKAYLIKALNPTINSSGYWVIGSTVTSIKAEGVTPLIRRGTNGIEASTDKGATYNTVALWSDLRPDFAGMSAEEKAAFKFNYSDFTAEEIAALQKPATDAAALVTDHITLCDAARDAANTAAASANAANTAAASANAAATLAKTQANRCKAFADNPIKIQYGTWWVWDEASSAYKDTGVSPANYVLTKSEVERVLTGEISSHSHAYLPLTGGTMSNTNLVNNLNADMLDGYHNGELTARKMVFSSEFSNGINADAQDKYITFSRSIPSSAAGIFPVSNNANAIINIPRYDVNYFSQLGFSSNGNIFYRSFFAAPLDLSTPWKQLAFITDNVASATKLQTARTIWGQSFDGTSDVTGNLDLNGNYLVLSSPNDKDSSGNPWYSIKLLDSGTMLSNSYNGFLFRTVSCSYNFGRYGMGIGTEDPQYLLHVAGTLYASGAATLASTLECAGLITAKLGIRVSNGTQKVDLTVGSDGLLYAGGKAVQTGHRTST